MLPRDSYFQFQIKKHKQRRRFYPRHSRDQKSKWRGHYIDTSHSIVSFTILEDLWGRRGQSE